MAIFRYLYPMTSINKQKKKGRVVRVDTEVVFGDEKRIKERIANFPVSSHVNTAFVERNNLTMGFSKEKLPLVESLNLYSAIYHFVKPNSSLKSELEVKDDNRRWLQKTPMMAAGITDHIWAEEELLTFKVFD